MLPDRLCLLVVCLSLVVSGSARSYGVSGLSKDDQTGELKRNVLDIGDDGIYIDGNDEYDVIDTDDDDGKTIDEVIVEATNKAHGIDSNNTTNSSDPNRLVTIEYDMVFTAKELEEKDNDDSSKDKRTAPIRDGVGGGHRWGTYIPYQFAPYTFSAQDKREIIAAMNDWAKYTCLAFGPATKGTRLYFRNGDGCSSPVGMLGDGAQNIKLSKGCRKKGTVIHEIGHALGLLHEQSRPDRNSFVTIINKNIKDTGIKNFMKRRWDGVEKLGIKYDYVSIMHYGPRAFSKNRGITIKTKDPIYQNLIGNRKRLSFRDIKTINFLQNCAEVNDCDLSESDCPGEGFVGRDCKCWCPGAPYTLCRMDGSTGNICQDYDTDCPEMADDDLCTDPDFEDYMATKCRKSCRLCTKHICRDLNTKCPAFAKAKYCNHATYKNYMTSKCQKSCGLCTDADTCTDDSSKCTYWADNGECMNSPKYMMSKCKYSCNVNNCRDYDD